MRPPGVALRLTLPVVRMCLATLRNLMKVSKAADSLLARGVLRLLHGLSTRSWADEDLKADLTMLTESLDQSVEGKRCVCECGLGPMTRGSTWDEYRKEVLSGELDWTPAHRSKHFWEENYHRLTERENQVLKMLIRLLKPVDKQNARILAVAAHDVGEFVRHHPKGRA